MVSEFVVSGQMMKLVSLPLGWKRGANDLSYPRIRPIGHKNDFIRQVDSFVHVVRDHQHCLVSRFADPAHLVLQFAARQRIER
ncbi:hypothetical protein D3C87_1961600 [compost metagenome]